MNLNNLSEKIKLIGKIGVVVSVIFLLAIIDDFIAGYREPDDLFRAMPGTEQPVNGNVDRPLETKDDVVFVCYSEGISMEFQDVQGRMWRGILKIGSYVDPGEYPFMVIPRGEEPAEETPRYRLRVFHTHEDYQRSFKSLLHRYTGIPPFWITIMMIPFIVASFGLVYYLSGKKDELLALQGKAEIFKIKKTGDNWELSFGLGQEHGITRGVPISLYNNEGDLIGTAEITEVFKTYAVACAHDIPELKPGSLASMDR